MLATMFILSVRNDGYDDEAEDATSSAVSAFALFDVVVVVVGLQCTFPPSFSGRLLCSVHEALSPKQRPLKAHTFYRTDSRHAAINACFLEIKKYRGAWHVRPVFYDNIAARELANNRF